MRRFIALSSRPAISQENFTFVFNKADELLGENESQRHQVLKEVLGDLTFRLKHEAGIEQPRIFSVSALCEFGATACDGVLRADFRKLRDFLMGKKDAKEIASIKTVNLMAETARLLDDLNREIQPEEKARVIRSIREQRGQQTWASGSDEHGNPRRGKETLPVTLPVPDS